MEEEEHHPKSAVLWLSAERIRETTRNLSRKSVLANIQTKHLTNTQQKS
jgi:hypothetical protein